MLDVYDINRETSEKSNKPKEKPKMSVEVKGLAATVRNAKEAIAKASDASAGMQQSAQKLVDTVAQVDAMRKEMDAAEAELQAALGTMTNGGPPLDTTDNTGSAVIPPTPSQGATSSLTGSPGVKHAVSSVQAAGQAANQAKS